ncbi:hypothetical protein [Streptomyces sp. NPDC001975]
MRQLLDKLETRQRLVRENVGRLREQITELTEQLASAERTLERLEITRETVLELATEDGTAVPEPLPAGYREMQTKNLLGRTRTAPRHSTLPMPTAAERQGLGLSARSPATQRL